MFFWKPTWMGMVRLDIGPVCTYGLAVQEHVKVH